MKLRFYHDHLQKNKGFTLLEVILALFVVLLILFLLNPMIQLNHRYLDEINQSTKQDWYVFTIQLEQTIKEFELISVAENRLIFQTEDQDEIKKPVIEYYAGKQLIRKSSVKGGYEPMLLNVEKVHFQYENFFVRMSVDFLNGEHYEYCLFKEK